MKAPRTLTSAERAVLVAVLTQSTFSGAKKLLDQVPRTRVCGGIATLLDLEVVEPFERAPVADGPAPVRAIVEAENGAAEGEILIWIREGRLDGLEFAWYVDQPLELHTSHRITVDDEQL